MVKNGKRLRNFEERFIKAEKLSFKEAIEIFEALWNEGIYLGVLPLKDSLSGIEVDIKMAKMLNSANV